MDAPPSEPATMPIWQYIEHLPIETRSDLLLVSLPSYGNVGPAAARILIDEAELPLVASIQSDLLPPAATAWQGIVSGPIQVWGKPMPSGPEGKGSGLLVLNSDVAIPMEGMMPFAHAVMDWARAIDVALVVTIEGRPERSGTGPLAAAANLLAEETAGRLGVEQPHTSLAGLAPAFLMHGNRVKVPVISLFADADNAEADPRAALLALATVAPYVPALELTSRHLDDKAHDIAKRVAQEQQRLLHATRELEERSLRGYA